jgi:hypothetical protein
MTEIERRIGRLWRFGNNTWDIAKAISVPESVVERMRPGHLAKRLTAESPAHDPAP